jgi:hypothetical protein
MLSLHPKIAPRGLHFLFLSAASPSADCKPVIADRATSIFT